MLFQCLYRKATPGLICLVRNCEGIWNKISIPEIFGISELEKMNLRVLGSRDDQWLRSFPMSGRSGTWQWEYGRMGIRILMTPRRQNKASFCIMDPSHCPGSPTGVGDFRCSSQREMVYNAHRDWREITLWLYHHNQPPITSLVAGKQELRL